MLTAKQQKERTVRLTNKAREFGVFEKQGNNLDFEFTGLEDPPGATVGQPGNHVTKVGTAQNGVHSTRVAMERKSGKT